MGLYNYERIAERLLKKLESLPPDSEEYKRTLYAYNKVTDKQPTFKHSEDVADYLRLKMASDPELGNVPSVSMIASHLSGDTVPSHGELSLSEKAGETVASHGGSPYNAAKSQDYSYDDFRSALSRYVSGAEQEEAAMREADTGVNINVPRKFGGLERIAEQALMKGRGGGELAFGDKWPYEVSRQPGAGSTSVPGGTFSVGGGVTGGDTEEDMRTYVDRYRNTEVDRQIGLIEQAFPAANRPPALDARLQDLYTARANRDTQETSRRRIPIEEKQAEADLIQARGMAEYYTEMPKAQRYGDDKAVEIAQINAGQKSDKEFNANAQKIVATLNTEASKTSNPKARAAAVYIGQIINRMDLTNTEKDRMIQEALAAVGYDNVAALTGTNLATPTGEDELDLLMYGTK